MQYTELLKVNIQKVLTLLYDGYILKVVS